MTAVGGVSHLCSPVNNGSKSGDSSAKNAKIAMKSTVFSFNSVPDKSCEESKTKNRSSPPSRQLLANYRLNKTKPGAQDPKGKELGNSRVAFINQLYTSEQALDAVKAEMLAISLNTGED